MENGRSILVATDFSECSRAALEGAADWGRRLGASLDVIHVWSLPSFPLPPAFTGDARANQVMLEQPRREAEAELERFVKRASNAGIFVRSARLEFGDCAEQISRVAERGGYDMVVVGTHGRSGLSRLMLGSIAEKVVRLSTRPVLTVHGSARAYVKAA